MTPTRTPLPVKPAACQASAPVTCTPSLTVRAAGDVVAVARGVPFGRPISAGVAARAMVDVLVGCTVAVGSGVAVGIGVAVASKGIVGIAFGVGLAMMVAVAV